MMYEPVCGSNRKTYNNECHLDIADCESHDGVYHVYFGQCYEPCPDHCPGWVLLFVFIYSDTETVIRTL